MVEGFEDGGASWQRSAGTVAIAASSDHTEGSAATALTYDLSAGDVKIVPKATPTPFATNIYSALKIDVKGDGSYNTLYVWLTDASGERFYYRVDAMGYTTWKTVTVDLTQPPTSSSGGNANGVLDAPLSLTNITIVRNGSQPATGTILLDNIRTITDNWTTPNASTAYFSPSKGQTANITFAAGTSGDYKLLLKDTTAKTRTVAATINMPGQQSITWDGKDDTGAAMLGNITASLSYDITPNGALTAPMPSSGNKSLTAVAEADVSNAVVVEGFEDGGASWQRSAGTVAIAASSDHTEGSAATALTYDLSAGDVKIVPKATPTPFATNIYSALKIDVKGDGSYNTLYVWLTDASGERFYYRVDAMGYTTWKTVTVDLTQPPTSSSGGNANGVLDAPLSLTNITIVRNGSQPATGTILLDNIRTITDNWTTPNASGQANFAPSAGQTANITFAAGAGGDYKLELKDASGLTKTFSGTAASAQTVSVSWDGMSDQGMQLAGNVNSVLSYDGTPDGSLSATPARGGAPFLLGVAARPQSATNSSPVSVNGEISTLDSPQEADQRAAAMEAAFVNYDREEFEWKRIEPSNGSYDWPKFDQTVAVASARNLSIIGKLVYSAPWASSAPAGTPAANVEYYPPTNIQDYVDYAVAVVHRYKSSVHVWEVWNEPDSSSFWMPSPDANAYSRMLKLTYAAIKAEDPSATVLTGGLVGFDYPFMETLRANNVLSSFDGLGLHTFVNTSPETSEFGNWLDTAAAYIAKYSPGKKIWITELSWSSCTVSPTCRSGVSEADQASFLSRAYLSAASRGVASIAWWNLVDYGSSGSTLDNYGLIESAGRQKPAYSALLRVGAALYQQTVAGPISPTADGKSTLVDDMASASPWKVSMLSGGSASLNIGSGRHGGVAGANLTYNFSGASTGVELLTNQKVAGEPSAISLWTYGDMTDSPIYIKFSDATGENFQGLIGNSSVQAWKRMTLYLDGGATSQGGGNADAKIDYPITIKSIFIYKSTFSGLNSGQIFLDDLSSHYGTVTRGLVLNGSEGITQAIYSTNSGTITVRSLDPGVFLRNGVTHTPLANSGGVAQLAISADPSFVVSKPQVSASSSKVGQALAMNWVAGDRTVATIQIIDSGGTVVRTLETRTTFDSGPQSEYWEGNVTGAGAAPAGSYSFRLTVYAQNQAASTDAPFVKTP
ncbi:beta-galactosidase [Subtercola sp. RTI3]|uniref:beta-galactosidase n=1 Tax=Subtercola sp. RTI3 TaxID=3048639 RepID=UPI002B23A2B8|nr:beta-galactosidase [Subtercola sp. RTI3]MEA9987213.1 beta-galactosidase [Subtercola sp. RTI3]